jgi:hypothetical protein
LNTQAVVLGMSTPLRAKAFTNSAGEINADIWHRYASLALAAYVRPPLVPCR